MAEKEKVGTVNTCPSCGAPVESFQTRCSSCGHELNQIQTTQSVQEFFQKLEALSNQEYRANKDREINESRDKAYKPQKKIGLGTVLLWIFFFWILWIPIVFRKAKGPYATAMAVFGVIAFFSLLLIYTELNPTPEQNTSVIGEQVNTETETTSQNNTGLPFPLKIAMLSISLIGMAVVFIIMKPKWTPEDKRRQSMIEMFPVPNSKEALMEFIILATGHIKQINPVARAFSLQAKHQLGWNEIWISKCKQIYTKARIAMKDDPSSLSAISQLMAEAGLNTAKAVN
jgi:DNA-directed RNA polymerase subunit RPC12/RpoP